MKFFNKNNVQYVLLVDDDDLVCDVHRVVLSQLSKNFKFVKVSNGREALEYLNSCEPNNFPNVILLDVEMPVMNGVDFLEAYSKTEFTHRAPVVVVSSTKDYSNLRNIKNYDEVLSFIPKPLTREKYQGVHDLIETKNQVAYQ